ncbi:28S ribosomal protein S18b, mitochondrial [Notolabrus celidotus]|uniref:28S ribosomal protein S18b, mitochondrial n=1 Tax=Notolabrus celidotus TaxID=1203425 RepID=UPI0014906BB4|nr:28S ribosomal protein S18b, mitochondrial [Notolabrus celidotus]XP_034560288.1 28S ribosomal protein S18b, mitochondrial [Notolabrus celidotus]XP_034560290.1 28S ribosomal protein S18b, mitochondrial [Notolabrus celidotus]
MAASMQGAVKAFCRLSPSITLPFRQYQTCLQRLPVRLPVSVPVRPGVCHPPCRFYNTADSVQDEGAAQATENLSRYKDRPWDYLDSEEYTDRYGSTPVWTGYRRNHKGGIPPQKTRKTCIRGEKICGNPCPICRDPNIIVHHQNVKLLQQFISPHTGQVFDPTRTGVCMKQQKKLNQAVGAARDHGLLPFQIPHVEFAGEDYSNSHDAVGSTPSPPLLTSGDSWYTWYGDITPDEKEVSKVRKLYRAYLKR